MSKVVINGKYAREEWLLPEIIAKKIQNGLETGKRAVVRIPGRIDLAGGWNDTPPYYFDNDAAVLITSVSFGNQWMVEVEVQKAEYFGFIENNFLQQPPIDHIVVLKVLEYLGIGMPPIVINIKNSIPKGSGLGGSGLLAAAVLASIIAYSLGAEYVIKHPDIIVNGVLMVEQLMGSGGGWQDDLGGILPGMKLVQTSPASCSNYRVKYLNDLVADRLSAYSLVINTGIRRRAANVLEPIRELYVQKNKAAIKMLDEIREYANLAYRQLDEVNIEAFAGTITNAWNTVVEVESRSTIPQIDQIKRICGKNLIGYKIAGAGGGGFAILIFSNEEVRNIMELKIQDQIPHSTVFRPIFGRYGMSIVQSGKSHRMNKKEKI